MDIKKIITDAHMAGQTNQGVDASWSEAHAYYTEFIKTNEVGNVAKPNACPQLAEVRARIECMMLITDCALDDTEQRRINRSFSDGYNKAIRDILNMMSEHFG